MEEIYAVRDVGRFSLFSTVVIQPTLLGRPDRLDDEERYKPYRFGYLEDACRVAAFGYCVGQRIPGTNYCATQADTNLQVAAQVVDEEAHVIGLSWRIPARTPGEFRLDRVGAPYEVSREDIREFVGTAKMAFYCGGEKPFYALPLVARPVVFDADDVQRPLGDEAVREDAVGSWGQWLTTVEPALPIARLVKFWWEVQFPDRIPHLGGPLTLVCVLDTERSRRVAV